MRSHRPGRKMLCGVTMNWPPGAKCWPPSSGITEIDLPVEQARMRNFDRQTLVALLQELGFRTLLNRLPDTEIKPEAAEDTRESVRRRLIATEAELERFLDQVRAARLLALDVETTSQDPMLAAGGYCYGLVAV
ncbi:MAG: hypothetical protein R2839_11875 [Thermomicrobiales bacterium]